MARRIVEVNKTMRCPYPYAASYWEESVSFGLGKKQVPCDTPEFLESVRQYNEWSQASQAYRQAQQNNRLDEHALD